MIIKRRCDILRNDFFNYKIPNRKKWLLTDEFLVTFRDELNRIFKVNENDYIPTYWNLYTHLSSTGGFYDALKIASQKHNVTNAIYKYAFKMPWYNSDIFDDEVLVLMYERGIIKEGDNIWTGEEFDLEEMELKGEIEWYEESEQRKDYTVIRRNWRFID